MARVKIVELPNKFISYWDDSSCCVIDTWLDFHTISVEDVQKTIIETVIPFIKKKNCDIHVVDNSVASGAFSRDVLDCFKAEVAERMKATDVRYFLTVASVNSPIANISMRNLSNRMDSVRFYAIEANSVQDGLQLIKRLKVTEKAA